MSNRVISDPAASGWELDPSTGYWMWAAGSGSGGGGSYDDTEVRGLIADNTTAISGNSDRIDALEQGGSGGSYTAGNGITITGNEIRMSGSYSGTFSATTVTGG